MLIACLFEIPAAGLLNCGSDMRIVLDYEDPHSSVPAPNHMFPFVFWSTVTLLGNGRSTPTGNTRPTRHGGGSTRIDLQRR